MRICLHGCLTIDLLRLHIGSYGSFLPLAFHVEASQVVLAQVEPQAASGMTGNHGSDHGDNKTQGAFHISAQNLEQAACILVACLQHAHRWLAYIVNVYAWTSGLFPEMQLHVV